MKKARFENLRHVLAYGFKLRFKRPRASTLFKGTPFFLSVLFIVFVTFLRDNPETIAKRYSDTALTLSKKHQFVVSRIFLEKALTFSPRNEDMTLGLGSLLISLGDEAGGLRLIENLTPEDEANPEATPGYRAAHLFLGNFILKKETATKEDFKKALDHYHRATRGDTLADPARQGIVSALIRMGDFREAEKILDAMLKAHPEWIGTVVRYYSLRGDEGRAQDLLHLTIPTLEDNLKTHPNDHMTRLALSECLTLTGKTVPAERILFDGMKLYPDIEAFHSAAIAPIVVRLTNKFRNPKAEVTNFDVQSILHAFAYTPHNEKLLPLAEHMGLQGNPSFLITILERQQKASLISELGLAVLATHAFHANKKSEAAALWEEAYKVARLCHCPLQFSQALHLANHPRLLSRPGAPECGYPSPGKRRIPPCGERGHLCTYGGKDRPALTDYFDADVLLERPHKDLERRLATLLEKVGDPEGAKHHAHLAEQITTAEENAIEKPIAEKTPEDVKILKSSKKKSVGKR